MQGVMLKQAYEIRLAVYVNMSLIYSNISTRGNTVNTVFKGYVKGFKAHQNCTRYVVRIVYLSVCVSTCLG